MSGCDAPTPPDSDDFMTPSVSVEPPVIVDDEPEQPKTETGRQKARAAVTELNPPEMLAELCTGFKKANVTIIENVCGRPIMQCLLRHNLTE